MDELEITFSEEDLMEHFTYDGVYEEVIKYVSITRSLDNIIYSSEFKNKEIEYLKSL